MTADRFPVPSRAEAARLLGAVYDDIAESVAALDDLACYGPTRLPGMAIADLLVHLRMDAERALVAFASPADGPPDCDFATYWTSYPGVDDPNAAASGVRWARSIAVAYQRPTVGLLTHYRDVTAAAARAAASCTEQFVATQGHVLTTADLVTTLVVEACIHSLDLQPSVATDPPTQALAQVARTLDEIAGSELSSRFADLIDYALKGSGRVLLSTDDHARLLQYADRFPLLH